MRPGVTHVVDTSHYPLRALELQRIDGIDLYLVYLVRDPQGVVASFNRHDVGEYTKSTLHTNVYLWVTHVLSLFVFLRHPRERRLLVRHEDFVADPGARGAPDPRVQRDARPRRCPISRRWTSACHCRATA